MTSRATTALFAVTLLASAFLLFCIEPLVAKMLLPIAGGATAVWSTCLVFFQLTLLAGYVFTLFASSKLSPRKHVAMYAVLFPLAILAMPIALHGDALGRFPAIAVLAMLVTAVGAPFFVLSTLAPAVQRWFASTRADTAANPYPLYAASNAGSLLALAAYPFVIEPFVDLRVQSRALQIAFGIVGVLVLTCALAINADVPATSRDERSRSKGIGWSRRLRWMLFAAIPSAQLVAVTTYLTTEVAPAPLLWAVPLATYLLTFVLVFSGKPLVTHATIIKRVPFVALVGMLLVIVDANAPAPLVFGSHVVIFFVLAMFCHGTMAADRPEAAKLPEFYAWMSLGGALGGATVALVAPLVLARPIEYPVCILLALACLPARSSARAPRWSLVVAAVAIALTIAGAWASERWTAKLATAAIAGAPLLVVFALDRFPRVFLWTVAAIFFVRISSDDARSHVVHRERSFFGAFAVTRSDDATALMHGDTLHGLQLVQEPHTPTLYYTREGPIGEVIAMAHARDVAVVGLGSGTLATYARAGEHWRFFELDPAVVRIARDPRYFTYLSDAFPDGADVVVGDARIELAKIDAAYDLLVVDAFTSDSIPTHLLTEEAFAMYRGKLAPDAIVAWHISNRHLDLSPELAALADGAQWVARQRDDGELRVTDDLDRRQPSTWIAMSSRAERLANLSAAWTSLALRPGFRRWTDQRASIVTVWKQ